MNQQASEDPPKLSLSELMNRLDDIDIPDEDLAPYLLAVPSETGRIEPSFVPNPALVTDLDTGLESALIVNGLNNRYRRQRNRVYRNRIKSGWDGPRIVEEGDSWFQYPLRLLDIIDFLLKDHAVMSLSGAGHTLAQMVTQDEIFATIAREQADVFILSAGGNDLFQGGNIANLIEPVVPGMPAKDLVGPTFDAFVDDIIGQYRSVLMRLHRAFPRMLMLIHGYSAAYSRMDRWIGRPLNGAGVGNAAAHNRVVEVMLERFNDAQIALSQEPAFDGKLVHVDLRPLRATPDDWFDEIHMGETQNSAAADLFARAISDNLAPGGLESEPEAAPPDTGPTLAVAAHARELMALDEGTLMAELDERLTLIDRDPSVADLPSSPLLVMAGGLESGAPAAPSGLAKRLLARWERELYELICGDSTEDKEEQDKLRKAMGIETKDLVMLVTGWLVSGPLGVPALLAGVLAAILVKRFGGATYEVVCDSWKDRLDGAST